MPNTLTLTIKKQWFDMIADGVKPEEYRDIKPYYASRLLYLKSTPPLKGDLSYVKGYIFHAVLDELLNDSLEEANESLKRVLGKIDTLLLRNGYSSSSPTLLVELKDVKIGEGNYLWGAEPNKRYFILKLGRILEIKNMEVKK